jgi:DNA-binding NarL/FixJ family response regulator
MMKPYKDFFAQQRILIVDESSVSRVSIARGLCELGALNPTISLAESFEAAQALIASRTFTILITEFELGSRCGIDLLKSLKHGSELALTAVITRSQGEAAAALAAENDVDIFLPKPFSMDTLTRAFESAIEEKRGTVSSELLLNRALTMLQKSNDRKRVYDRIAYRALTRIFDALMAEGKKTDAYLVLRRLVTTCPLNPERLKTALRLAVETRNFGDVNAYYEKFLEIDSKGEELVRYMYAAQVSSGKAFLKEGDLARAMEQFRRAALTSGKHAPVLREIVLALLEEGYHSEADAFISAFPQHERQNIGFLTLDYLVMSKSQPLHRVLQRGRELIQDGYQHPMIYGVLIQACKDAGHVSEAESLALDAGRLGAEAESPSV